MISLFLDNRVSWSYWRNKQKLGESLKYSSTVQKTERWERVNLMTSELYMATGKHNWKVKKKTPSFLVEDIGEYFNIKMNHFFFMLSFPNFYKDCERLWILLAFWEGEKRHLIRKHPCKIFLKACKIRVSLNKIRVD